MPIGRAASLDLMMTPAQRVTLHNRVWQAALNDPEYTAGLEAFGRELANLTDPTWRDRYLNPTGGQHDAL